MGSYALFFCCWIAFSQTEARPAYPWINEANPGDTIGQRFTPPKGYTRTVVAPGSFAEWLRGLPLRPGAPEVLLHTGQPKQRQDAHAAVVAMDVGKKDLQQCADTIMRLRGEYLFSLSAFDRIHFLLSNGTDAPFERWADGARPHVQGNFIEWRKDAPPSHTHQTLRQYLDFVFTYASTRSLDKEAESVSQPSQLAIGDFFVAPGSPGHAVLVADMATAPDTGAGVFLLVQGFMPAQEAHVLRNLQSPSFGAWYKLDPSTPLYIPEWTFQWSELKRFPADDTH